MGEIDGMNRFSGGLLKIAPTLVPGFLVLYQHDQNPLLVKIVEVLPVGGLCESNLAANHEERE